MRPRFTNYDANILRSCFVGVLRDVVLDLADRLEAAADPDSPKDHDGHMRYMREMNMSEPKGVYVEVDLTLMSRIDKLIRDLSDEVEASVFERYPEPVRKCLVNRMYRDMALVRRAQDVTTILKGMNLYE